VMPRGTTPPKNVCVSMSKIRSCRVAIRKAREAVGLSQLELANLLSVPEIKVSRVETGRDPLSRDLALRIHSALALAFRTSGGRA
jgi:ribosome-binding protein aMBF1 (putative translation factor)